MKKIFLLLVCCVSTLLVFSQAEIKFTQLDHDFGEINEGDGPVSTIFEFENSGTAPLILSNVTASCGCTTPEWTKEPVEPGKKGQVKVTYNPKGRPGKFVKTITVSSNAKTSPYKVRINGYVLPKIATMVDTYTEKIDLLSVQKRSVDFGILHKTDRPAMEQIEYGNYAKSAITVELQVAAEDADFLTLTTTQRSVEPKQIGTMNITLNPAKTKGWGPQETDFLVVVNDRKVDEEAYKIKVLYEIEDDFSKLDIEQRMQAPMVEIARTIDLGVVQKGKTQKKTIQCKNVGINTLEIRRIYKEEDALTFIPSSNSIKGGKTADITIECKGNLGAGKYTREAILYTNAPDSQKIILTISWEEK